MTHFCFYVIFSLSLFFGGFALYENPRLFGQVKVGISIKDLKDSESDELAELEKEKLNINFFGIRVKDLADLGWKDLIEWATDFLEFGKKKIQVGVFVLNFLENRQPEIRSAFLLDGIFQDGVTNQIIQNLIISLLQSTVLAGGSELAGDTIRQVNLEVFFSQHEIEWWVVAFWVLVFILICIYFIFGFRGLTRGYLYGPNWAATCEQMVS